MRSRDDILKEIEFVQERLDIRGKEYNECSEYEFVEYRDSNGELLSTESRKRALGDVIYGLYADLGALQRELEQHG